MGDERGTERLRIASAWTGTVVPTPSGRRVIGVVSPTMAHVATSRGEESRYAPSAPAASVAIVDEPNAVSWPA
jgi:hypothetical protein